MKVEVKGKIKERVQSLLERLDYLRDDDNRLIANIWLSDAGGVKAVNNMSAMDFLAEIAKGKLTSAESIMRCRRKVQEQIPKLRGKNYQSRKDNEGNIKKDLL